MSTVNVTEDTFTQTIENNDIVIVDAGANWCEPCKAFSPIFEEASEKHSDITFAKLDTEANPGLSAALQIQSIPTLIVFREGIHLGEQVGALRPGELEELIEQIRNIDMDEVHRDIAQQNEKQGDN